MEPTWNQQVNLAQQLVHHLERLSADSAWAHRGSGVKAAIIRCLEALDTTGRNVGNPAMENELHNYLDLLIKQGFAILKKSAEEIRAPER